MKLFVGIDPGKQGAICFRNTHSEVDCHVIPMIGDEYDIFILDRMFKAIKHHDIQAVLEDVHSIYGVGSTATFQFGRGLGIIEGLLTSNSIPYLKVAPRVWQKLVYQGIPEKRKPNTVEGKLGKLDNKIMSHLAARRLYPKVNLKKSSRCKNDHMGIIDALCMMHYCYMNFKIKNDG